MQITIKVLCGIACGALTLAAGAQQFPSRPVTIVVPFPPAGITDTQSRLVGNELQKRLGQPVIIENRPGAGGAIGYEYYSKLPADGHAILSGASPQVHAPLFVKGAKFAVGTDVTGLAGIIYAPYILITNTQVPAKTFKEFIDHARANPGKLNYATVGGGISLVFKHLLAGSGIRMEEVTYKGGADALKALLANETQLYTGAALGLEENVKAGKITALAVTSAKRFDFLPQIPTVKEVTGIQDYDWGSHYGFYARPGTPAPIVDRLFREIADIMRSPTGEKLTGQGYELRISSPADYTQVLLTETKLGQDIAKRFNIQPQ
jgi:tripartite-type tricarboxylate transporter receptor subunit TctC